MGESHIFLMLGTLSPDSKSLGHSVFLPLVCSRLHSVPPLLTHILVVFFFLAYTDLYWPSQGEQFAGRFYLPVSPMKNRVRGQKSCLSDLSDDTEK